MCFVLGVSDHFRTISFSALLVSCSILFFVGFGIVVDIGTVEGREHV